MIERCRCDECEAPDWAPEKMTYEEGIQELVDLNRNEGDSINFYGLMDAMCANWGLPSATVLQDMDEVM